MNTNILKTAKDLIKKGTILNDPELIKMGNDLLENLVPTITPQPTIYQYICSECGNSFPIDKERKRCPKCKKSSLKKIEINSVVVNQSTKSNDTSQFHTQIRDMEKSRTRFNERGEPDGMYRRSEPVTNVHNEWNDSKEDGHDKANELLKNFTKVSARTRQAPKQVKVVCSECKQDFYIHPIHRAGRTVFMCDLCIRRKRRV